MPASEKCGVGLGITRCLTEGDDPGKIPPGRGLCGERSEKRSENGLLRAAVAMVLFVDIISGDDPF